MPIQKTDLWGISSASEIFQHTVAQVLDRITGVRNISDDIIIFGKDTQKTAEEAHNTALRQVLQRLRERGLTLNADKCKFNQSTLLFFGHVFGKGGMSPVPSKVEAVQEYDAPSNLSEVRSLLGMGNFCSRYMQSYADIVKPLRELTKNCSCSHKRKVSRLGAGTPVE